MSSEQDKGYCLEEGVFYPDDGRAFQECPNGHLLAHPQICPSCNKIYAYFQCDDDYVGPDDAVEICLKCVKRELKHENTPNQ